MTIALVIAAAAAFLVLLYRGHGYWAWSSAAGLGLVSWRISETETSVGVLVVVAIFIALVLVFGIPALRRTLISNRLMALLRPLMPRMSDTERTAIEAGTVWWDADLFSGRPEWTKLLDFKVRPLSKREQEFLDGPVEELCRKVDDWQISQERELPPHVWDFLKQKRFFGMIIPEKYGGLGFSAIAHSAVVTKVASRSIPVACTLMVPNSLGPAELLLHYGTDKQKEYYLPRLASGEEIPCFALTEPHAGSDAASSRSLGVVSRGVYEGREIIGISINLSKRYITLAPLATVIGLAFAMKDPDGLLGERKDLGITCALIPRNTPGLLIGERHDPMGVPFPNGPITGVNIFVPLDYVIGGKEGIGRGWRMLMECLAAGRSISLPALSVAAIQMVTRMTGAYASIREQFNLPIGRFEGVEERLTRIAGYSYLMDAARVLTCGAVDAGERPAVVSGVAKAYLTDAMRSCLSDAMDIMAGAALCRGPRNLLSRVYVAAPIAITVEGANILTRSLIIFGQGSIRCHPFVREEISSIEAKDGVRFDKALFQHFGFVCRNALRSLVLALGVPTTVPGQGWKGFYLRRLTRFSASFALVTDVALATLGASLKRQEKITGRMADALAWMYLASAAIKRFHDADGPASELPLLRWSCDLALWTIQEALCGVINNLPNRTAAAVLRILVFPLGARLQPPRDSLAAEVGRSILDGGEMRKRLTQDIFVPDGDEDGLGRLEAALELVVSARGAQRKTQEAISRGVLAREPIGTLPERATSQGILDADEGRRMSLAAKAQEMAIQVDSFAPAVYGTLKG
jgi:acyl-CoA dehydrogenase